MKNEEVTPQRACHGPIHTVRGFGQSTGLPMAFANCGRRYATPLVTRTTETVAQRAIGATIARLYYEKPSTNRDWREAPALEGGTLQLHGHRSVARV